MKLFVDGQEVKKPPKQHEAIGLGRNCYIFHTARFWAYKAVREYRGKTYNNWLQAVIDHCLKLNEGITEPMQYNEVKGIAKSISRYCWKKDAYHYQEFIDRQSRKGKLGNSSNGGKARSNIYIDKRQKALQLNIDGMNKTQIAKELDVDRKTVARWLKKLN